MFLYDKCIQTSKTSVNSVQTRLRSRWTCRQPLVHAMLRRWTNPSMVLTFVLLSSVTNTVQTKPIQNFVSPTDLPVPEETNTGIQEHRARITSMLWLQHMDPIPNVPTAKREELSINLEHIGWYHLDEEAFGVDNGSKYHEDFTRVLYFRCNYGCTQKGKVIPRDKRSAMLTRLSRWRKIAQRTMWLSLHRSDDKRRIGERPIDGQLLNFPPNMAPELVVKLDKCRQRDFNIFIASIDRFSREYRKCT
ncbi:hypothetical protein CSKR_110029 [Clonorchis sinensis]|uniref:Uncharacterized protein n=2 Tax=Clonorchis sinensis TaxID=79923 RepID=G7YC24_CLOSI|nr:hypothetical protein CSKR_110029 [Clonorchis sinensis]GAA50508.1 hypothetical protein CLF_104664 [Clonorchis sinensis]